MGDLNCYMLLSSLNNVNTQALVNITDIYNLKQLINEPTRVTPVSSTLIDVIFTSNPDNVSSSGISHVGISDHSLIYVFRKISLPSAVKRNNTVSYRQSLKISIVTGFGLTTKCVFRMWVFFFFVILLLWLFHFYHSRLFSSWKMFDAKTVNFHSKIS